MNQKFKFILLGISLFVLLLFLSGCDFTQYIAHYANMAGWTTKINIQNPYNQDINVTLYVYDNDGNEITNEEITVPARGFYNNNVANIFSETIPDTGSIKIVSEEPGLVQKISAIILFEYNDGPSMGGLQSFSEPQKVLNFPWFQNDSNYKTGIAILNVNSWPIQVVMKATESDGTVHMSNTQTLNPMERIIGYPGDFFPDTLNGNYNLTVEASGKVAGFIILHNSSISKVEAINGVPVIPFSGDFFSLYNTNLDLNGHPMQMLLSRDGSTLYVSAGSPANKLFVIDTSDFTIKHEINFNVIAYMALSPDGKDIFVADNCDSKVYRINTTNFVKNSYTLTPNSVVLTAVSNNGRYFAAASSTNYIVWDLNGGEQIINGNSSNIWGCIFTEDSKYLLIIDHDNSTLIATELSNTSNKKTVNLSGNPLSIIQGTNNGSIYVGNNNDKIDVLAYPSFNLNNSLSAGGGYYSLAFSPDGRYLFAPSASDGKMYIYDTYAGEFKDPINLGGEVQCIGVSPDGDYVFYALDTSPYTLRAVECLPVSTSKNSIK